MFIKTKLTNNQYWPGWALFDTDTGIKYSIIYHRMGNEIHADVESAHAAVGEYGTGIRYNGEDALSFWSDLRVMDESLWQFIDDSCLEIMKFRYESSD